MSDSKCAFVHYIEEWAARTPGHRALVVDGQALTYHELDEQAGRLAARMRAEHSVEAGQRVGVLMHRSLEQVVAIVAILKLNATYVPVNPTHPSSLVRAEFTGTHAALIVTMQTVVTNTGAAIDVASERLKDVPIPTMYVGASILTDRTLDVLSPLTEFPNPYSLIIHTSGSSGHPKGIAHLDRSLVDHLAKACCLLRCTDADVILQLASNGSIDHILDTLGPLSAGATLVLPPPDADLDGIATHLACHSVTKCIMTQAIFNAFINANPRALETLQLIILAGEPASLPVCKKAQLLFKSCGPKVVNWLGAAEAIWAGGLQYELDDTIHEYMHTVPVGTTVSEAISVVLLNQEGDGSLVTERHTIGVIAMGGPHIPAAGYIDTVNQGQVNDFAVTVNGIRHYKHEDLGKIDDRGNFHCLGRTSRMVKLHGQRLELDGLLVLVESLPDVEQAAVVPVFEVTGDRASPVVAVTVFYRGRKRSFDDMVAELEAGSYPFAKTSHRFRHVTEPFAVNANGKVDLHELTQLAAEATSQQREEEVVPPATPLEAAVADLIAAILKTPRDCVSMTDSFVELGLDSMREMIFFNVVKLRAGVQTLRGAYTVRSYAEYLKSHAVDAGRLGLTNLAGGCTAAFLAQTATPRPVVLEWVKPGTPEVSGAIRCATMSFVGTDEHGQSIPASEPFVSEGTRFSYSEFHAFVAEYVRATIDFGMTVVGKDIETGEVLITFLCGDCFDVENSFDLEASIASEEARPKVMTVFEALEIITHNPVHELTTQSGVVMEIFISGAIRPVFLAQTGEHPYKAMVDMVIADARRRGYGHIVTEPTNSYSENRFADLGWVCVKKLMYADFPPLAHLAPLGHSGFAFFHLQL